MNLWLLLIPWIGGWILIFILAIINLSTKEVENMKRNVQDALLSDANNLFKTGIFYYLFNVACIFLPYPVVHWILMIVGILFCIPPIISMIGVLKTTLFWKGNTWLSFLGALICTFSPLIMALNIYFVHIR